MMNMFRARWYAAVRTVQFWGFIVLLLVLTASITSATVRSGDAPIIFNGLNVMQGTFMPALVVMALCLWLVTFATWDERSGTPANTLVGPHARRDYALAGMMCSFAMFLCLSAAALAGAAVGVLMHGMVPPVTPDAVVEFLRCWVALAAVAMAYGSITCLIVSVLRRTAASLIAVLVVLSGAVEGVLAMALALAGCESLFPVVSMYVLNSQVVMLSIIGAPDASATVFAVVLAVLFGALAVIVTERRAIR